MPVDSDAIKTVAAILALGAGLGYLFFEDHRHNGRVPRPMGRACAACTLLDGI
jgi:hypothetical protein